MPIEVAKEDLLPPSTSLSREQAWLLAVSRADRGICGCLHLPELPGVRLLHERQHHASRAECGEDDLAGAGYNFLPIPIFVADVFIGTFLVYSCLANRLRLLFAIVAALLLLGIATAALTPGTAWLGIIALSLAMGIMNTSVTSVGPQKINLGYVSGT